MKNIWLLFCYLLMFDDPNANGVDLGVCVCVMCAYITHHHPNRTYYGTGTKKKKSYYITHVGY